jgi:hypothetical protein
MAWKAPARAPIFPGRVVGAQEANHPWPSALGSLLLANCAMASAAMYREEGNKYFLAGSHELAAAFYSRAIQGLGTDEHSDRASKCFSNRCACWNQLREFDLAITDATWAIQADAMNVRPTFPYSPSPRH